MSTSTSGTSSSPVSSSISWRTYSTVFAANRSSSGPMFARAPSMAASTVLRGLAHAGGDDLGADQHPVAVDRDRRTLVDRLHDLGADVVDEGDAGLAQQQRAQVGVAAADRRGGVDHRDGRGVDQRLGGHPVEVLVVDDRDVARAQALDQALGAAVDPGHAGDRRRRRHVAATQRRPREPAQRRGPSGGPPRRGPWSPTPARARRSGARRTPAPSGARLVAGGGRATQRPRSPAAVASSSAAWTRAASLSGWPDSMRDSSTTRSPWSSRLACATVAASSLCLATRTCASA